MKLPAFLPISRVKICPPYYNKKINKMGIFFAISPDFGIEVRTLPIRVKSQLFYWILFFISRTIQIKVIDKSEFS